MKTILLAMALLCVFCISASAQIRTDKFSKDPSFSAAKILIASATASNSIKNQADYVADGVDDHVQVHAAITELGAVGGTIELSQGIFIVDTINMASNICIVGQGMGATTIQLEAGDSKNRVIDFDADSNTCLMDLTIDSNGDNNTNQAFEGLRGIEIHNGSNNVYITRTEIKNSGGSNYKVYGSQNVNIVDCVANGTGNGNSGPQWGSNIEVGANTTTTKNIRVEGCYVTGGSRSGIGIRAGIGDTEDIIVTNNHFYQNSQNNELKGEIQVEVGERLKNLTITGNTIEMDATKNSIGIAMIGNNVEGAVFANNVIRGTSNLYHRGIQVQDAGGVGNSTEAILFTANTLIGDFFYGVFSAADTYFKMVNNNFQGANASSRFWNLTLPIGEGTWIENNSFTLLQPVDCTDTGDANPGTVEIIPYTSLISVNQNDADGCNVTVGRTGITTGRRITIISPTVNPMTISDGGSMFMAGDMVFGFGDSLSLVFLDLSGGFWVEESRSDN